MTFEVWAEGYRCNGNRGTHYLLGKAEGVNFHAACVKLLQGDKYFSEKHLAYWGCGLYSNASDAAEVFG
jgi:hypothetical protein